MVATHYFYKIEDRSGAVYVGVTYCTEDELEDKLLQVTTQYDIDAVKYEAVQFTDETITIKI